MKRTTLLLVVLLVTACASNSTPRKVQMEIVQITGPSVVQPRAPFDVQLGVAVRNVSNEPITVRRLQLSQISTGAWRLRSSVPGIGENRPLTFNTLVQPGREETVSFWMHADYVAAPGSLNEAEPVTLRAVVFFEAPSGSFHDIVQTMIQQWR